MGIAITQIRLSRCSTRDLLHKISNAASRYQMSRLEHLSAREILAPILNP